MQGRVQPAQHPCARDERGSTLPRHGQSTHPPRPPIVELNDANVVYPGGHVGIERVSMKIDRGEFLFLVGPTGCGKSTFIKLLLRDLAPASGSVMVAGKDINEMDRSKVPMLRRRIGTVF